MIAFLWAILIVAAATLIHVGWWRVRLPRRQTRTLLLLYVGCLVAGYFISLAVAPRFAPTVIQWIQIAIFVIAMTLAYVITYSAVEADSPTLVMIRSIANAGDAGLSDAELFAAASDERLIDPRVADLVRDGLARRCDDGERLELTPKGRRFVAIFIAYRALLGAGKGG